MMMIIAATIPPIAPPDIPPLLSAEAVSFCVVDVDEAIAPEDDALAVGFTTTRVGWVLVDETAVGVDEDIKEEAEAEADELGWTDEDFAAEEDALVVVAAFFVVVVVVAFLVVEVAFLVVVESSFANLSVVANNNNNNINNENLFLIARKNNNKLYIQLFYLYPNWMV